MIPAYVKYLGDTSSKSAGTTIAQVLQGGGSAAGNLIVARVIFDNAATASKPIVSSISKMAGETNNWVFLGAARSTSTSAGAFASGEMWCIQTTVAWTGTITVTLDTSVTQKAVLMEEFSGAQAVLRSTVGTAYSTTTTAASAATTGTAPAINDLALGFIFGSNAAAQQSADTDTTAGTWSARSGLGSTGGNVATNNFGFGQYKVLTAATHQTFNSAGAMTAGNGSIVAILQSRPDPAISLTAYQFFDEAGTESSAAALAAVDTPVTGNITVGDGYGMIRVRLQSTTAVAVPTTDDWQLQYEKNGNGNWQNVVPDPGTYVETLSDSYPETEALVELNIGNFVGGYPHKQGQSFIGNGHKLNRIGHWAMRLGTGAGNLSCEIHEAASLSNPTPLDPVLATSTVFSILSVGTTKTWVYFQFDGSFTLQEGVPYVGLAYIDSVSTNTYFIQAVDNTAPTHPGAIGFWYTGFNTWDHFAGYDMAFRLYSTPNSSVYITVPYDNPNLTEGAATTNRLGAGTGSFVAGRVSEDGQVNDLGWAGNNYTEILFSVKLIAANLADGDTLRFRVLRNGATTGMTYAVTPTVNLVAGPQPGKGTGTLSHDWVGSAVGAQPLPSAVTQAAYRFYADDAGFNTPLAALDTAPVLDVSTPIVLRMRLQETNGVAVPSTTDWQLEYEKNLSGTWSAVMGTQYAAEAYLPGLGVTMGLTSASGGAVGAAQSFLGNGQKLTRASFWLSRNGTPPDGTLTAYLYAHTGTFGTSSAPTGAPLATSTSINCVSVPTGTATRQDFDFNGSFTLVDGTAYCIAIVTTCTGAWATNDNALSYTTSDTPYPGRRATYNGTTWSSTNGDLCFQIWTLTTPSNVAAPFNSAYITDNANVFSSRTGAGTGSYVQGRYCESGRQMNFGWTASNYTEFAFTIQLQPYDLVNGDTVRFRLLKDGSLIGMTHASIPSLSITKGVIPTLGLGAWWDASDASTFTYKSGVAVSQWRDKSAAAKHLTGPVVGNAYRNGTVNGLTSVVVADHLDSSVTDTPVITSIADNWAMFIVCRRTGGHATNSIPLMNGSGPATGVGIAVRAGGSNGYGFLVGGIAWNQSTTPDDGGTHLHSLLRSSGIYGHYIDGIATSNSGQALQTPNSPATDRTFIPANISDHAFGGDLCEIVLYSRALNGSERLWVESYLRTKWVPLPPKYGTGTFSWAEAVAPAPGKRTPKSSPVTTFLEAVAAVGKRVARTTVAAAFAYTEVIAAAGKKAPRATVTVTYTENPVAVGKRAPKATATGGWSVTAAAVGGQPTVLKSGSGTIAWSMSTLGGAAGTAPASIANLTYWYDTDAGAKTLSSGTPISFSPVSGYGVTVTGPVEPKFQTTIRNGLTTFLMTGGDGGFGGMQGHLLTPFTGTQYSVFASCMLVPTSTYARLFSLSNASDGNDWNIPHGAAFFSKEAGFPSIVHNGQQTSSPINDDERWGVFGIVVDGSNLKLYADGVIVHESNSYDSNALNSNAIGLFAKAHDGGDTGDSWRGEFGSLCFYARTLVPAEISGLTAYLNARWNPVYSDDFNRANGALGAPWVTVEGTPTITNSKFGVASGLDIARYNQTIAADQWAEADVAGHVEGGTCIGPAVRVNGTDLVYMWFSNVPARIAIWKRVGGTYTMLASTASVPPTAFKARLEVVGTTYSAYADGVLVASGTDSSIATGQPGVLGANGAGATLDNWRGGDMPYTALGGGGGAVGKETPKGAGTMAWATTCAAVGKKASKAAPVVAYTYNPVAVGKKAPKSAAATINWTEAVTSVGKRTPKASALTTWTEALLAAGKRAPKSSITTTWVEALTAVGKRAPRATALVAWLEALVVTGSRTPKGTITTSHSWVPAAVGARPVVGQKQGAATTQWVATNLAAGKRAPKATATTSYVEALTVAGKKIQRGVAGAIAWAAAVTSVGKRTPQSTVTTTALQTVAATGKRTPVGAASTGFIIYNLTAQGVRPIVGVKQGSGISITLWTLTAAGYRVPKGGNSRSVTWATAAVGKKTQRGTANPITYTEAVTAVGKKAPKSAPSTTNTWVATAQGKKTPKGTPNAGNHTWTLNGQGSMPLVGYNKGSGSTVYLWAPAAVGRRAPKGNRTLTYTFVVGAVGKKNQRGTAQTTVHLWTTSAVGKKLQKSTLVITHVWVLTASGHEMPEGRGDTDYWFSQVALGLSGIAGAIEGQWNGEEVVGMQYGDKAVIEWLMIPS